MNKLIIENEFEWRSQVKLSCYQEFEWFIFPCSLHIMMIQLLFVFFICFAKRKTKRKWRWFRFLKRFRYGTDDYGEAPIVLCVMNGDAREEEGSKSEFKKEKKEEAHFSSFPHEQSPISLYGTCYILHTLVLFSLSHHKSQPWSNTKVVHSPNKSYITVKVSNINIKLA